MSAQDVLHAWRDFECSFFASSLLAPRIPFRRFLTRTQHRVQAGMKLELTPSLIMRRMTRVSAYPYWHFFDAYPPGFFRAVYRGNGIPLPWGNLAQVGDPCPHWAVFRTINGERGESGSQISVLRTGDRSILYCCHSCACATWPVIRMFYRLGSISRRRSTRTVSRPARSSSRST